MRILYVNHYAGSPEHGMEYRPFYLSREWVGMGHSVRIVAADRSHIRSVVPNLYGKQCFDQEIDGIHYTWLKTRPYSGNGPARVLNMISFVTSLYRRAREIVREFRPDIVIASSTYPMDIWAAHRIARIAKAKLVFEVHDLWPLSPMELGGMSKWHPFIMLVQAAEDYAYRNSAVVVSMLPKVHEYMESRGLDLRRLAIVPNGISLDEWDAREPLTSKSALKVLSELRKAGHTIVGYAGTHGVANALDTLLDAAVMTKMDKKIVYVLVGMGPDKEALRARANAAGIVNVYFCDPVPKRQMPSLLEWFDIAFIGSHRQPLYRFGIAPNKLMDYMMSGRVVLQAIEAGNDPINDAGCGLTVEPDNPKAIVDGIYHLMALSDEQRVIMGKNGCEFVLREHTYPVLAKRFLEACT